MSDPTPAAGGPGYPASLPSEMPTTRPGKTSMWLALAFVVGFALNMPLVGLFGRTGAPDWLRLVLPAWGVSLMATGVAAGLCSAWAALRFKERSWAVMIAMLPGAFALMFVLGEFLVPH